MKSFIVLCIVLTSFSAFANPECQLWADDVKVLEAHILKLSTRLVECDTDLQCREVFAHMQSLEGQKKNLLTKLELYCK